MNPSFLPFKEFLFLVTVAILHPYSDMSQLPALCRTFLWRGFAPGFVNYKKGCTPLAAASDKIYQLLVHGRWFSPGTPAASTTKTGHHDIAKILLKVALITINQIINHVEHFRKWGAAQDRILMIMNTCTGVISN